MILTEDRPLLRGGGRGETPEGEVDPEKGEMPLIHRMGIADLGRGMMELNLTMIIRTLVMMDHLGLAYWGSQSELEGEDQARIGARINW